MRSKGTWHDRHQAACSFGDHLADKLARIVGSWVFIIAQTLIVAAWVAFNLLAYLSHWDPYPFILLNLLFSTQSAYAAPVIMMAQNRQNERDRVQAHDDYITNIEAKEEIEELQKKLNRIETEKLDKVIVLLQNLLDEK